MFSSLNKKEYKKGEQKWKRWRREGIQARLLIPNTNDSYDCFFFSIRWSHGVKEAEHYLYTTGMGIWVCICLQLLMCVQMCI